MSSPTSSPCLLCGSPSPLQHLHDELYVPSLVLQQTSIANIITFVIDHGFLQFNVWVQWKIGVLTWE
jgi:hypothetical protein